MSEVNWQYAGVMLLAIIVGITISRWTQQPLGLTVTKRLGIALGAFCGAMLGAKLPFALANWQAFLEGGLWYAAGKTIVLGLVGGYLGVEVAKWALDIHVKTGDSFAVPVAAAIAVGRLGCFVGGCCYGTPTSLPWGVAFADGIARHPTQLYEAMFHATAAIVLYAMWRRKIFPGQLIKLYILAYLVYRFATEWIRPEPQMWLGLTGYQWAAAVCIPVFVWLWIRDAKAMASSRWEPAASV